MILAPYATRFHGPGMEEGPAAVADALGIPAAARRVVPFELDAPVDDALRAGLPRLAEAVATSSALLPVALLGECTLAPAALAGARRRAGERGLACVWLDAHGDLNTPATSPSGFLGGMPYAIALGLCHPELAAAAGLDPLDDWHAALVGARDLDPGERALLDRSRIVETATAQAALAALPEDTAIHLHVDGDVLDPSLHPAVDFPAPGGWTEAQLADAIEAVLATGRVVAASVCWGNPRRQGADRSAEAARATLGPLARAAAAS